jgi:hypothetical protein
VCFCCNQRQKNLCTFCALFRPIVNVGFRPPTDETTHAPSPPRLPSCPTAHNSPPRSAVSQLLPAAHASSTSSVRGTAQAHGNEAPRHPTAAKTPCGHQDCDSVHDGRPPPDTKQRCLTKPFVTTQFFRNIRGSTWRPPADSSKHFTPICSPTFRAISDPADGTQGVPGPPTVPLVVHEFDDVSVASGPRADATASDDVPRVTAPLPAPSDPSELWRFSSSSSSLRVRQQHRRTTPTGTNVRDCMAAPRGV